MENKAKKLTREGILYLVFGVLTTAVSWGTQYIIQWPIAAIWQLEYGGTAYKVLSVVATVIAWICAVLFAFFTNRAFVFKDADKKANIWVQLAEFGGGRVLTLLLFEIALYQGLIWILDDVIIPRQIEILTVDVSDWRGYGIDLFSKGVASVANIVANYIIGKFLVFRKAKAVSEDETE